ncbi:MAG TPA: hypothetical protein ENH82_15625 [bacterium]|nr:hypothetical protein [bacterium]
MNQSKNIKLIKKIFRETFPHVKFRFIKIHGSQYQETGLPDLMILCDGIIDLNQSVLFQQRQMPNFWIEIKRDWNDTPTNLQLYNVQDLRQYQFITGFMTGEEFKLNWGDKAQTLKRFLDNNI